MVRLSIAVALFLLADGRGGPCLAFGSRAAGVAGPLPFATVAKGSRSGIREPERLVLRSAPDWERLWERHTIPLQPPPPLPPVDFSQETVIAIFRGETEGGFHVEIRRIEEQDGRLVVYYYAFSPPPHLPLGVAIRLQPYHIVKLARSALEVTFRPDG